MTHSVCFQLTLFVPPDPGIPQTGVPGGGAGGKGQKGVPGADFNSIQFNSIQFNFKAAFLAWSFIYIVTNTDTKTLIMI